MQQRGRHGLNGDTDLELFRELYKDMAPALVFYAGRYVDRTTAEDLVQDVFLRVWQKQTPLLLKEGLKTYLYRSVQHACLDCLRHRQVKDDYLSKALNRLKIEELNHAGDLPSPFEEDDRLLLVYEEMEKLPQKCRDVFVMAWLEGRRSSDIAALLNISRRTVEAQLYKALKRLRQAICGRDSKSRRETGEPQNPLSV